MFLRPVVNGKKRSITQWRKQKFCSTKCVHKFCSESKKIKTKLRKAWKRNPNRNLPTGDNHWGVKAKLEREKHYTPKVCELCEKSFVKKETTRPADWRKQRFCSTLCVNKYASSHILTGEAHHKWKGGKSSLNEKIRKIPIYAEWRLKVYERDNFTCQHCKEVGGTLNADHIISLAVLIEKYELKTLRQARKCTELWDISNGQTLCFKCHKETDTFGGRTSGTLH